ncbi:helix-turn-helix domain-containing protein [Streptomyces sp. P1-3]|uniref:helix-turn-helix domain-containing protein n=1 Tax=Streptomyces sp. P1-3 TaxID=3421658 RepID=UPI003D36FBAF
MTDDQAAQDNRVSTVLGRKLGGELLQLRLAAGLTQGEAAKAITASTGKVAKMERGWVPMREPDIRALCERFGVSDPAAVGGLLELARIDRERRKAKGWWNDFSRLGDMHEYVALESAATTVTMWQVAYVPGLLQTPAYIRALNSDEQFVSARLARQQRLTEATPLALRVVIFEAALRNLVGGAEVMKEQLTHLAAVATRPNITVQVRPFSAGSHPQMDSAFNIMSFAEPGAMDVVYMEVPFTRLWIEGGEGAAQHVELFETIARQALSEGDSQAFIKRISEEL